MIMLDVSLACLCLTCCSWHHCSCSCKPACMMGSSASNNCRTSGIGLDPANTQEALMRSHSHRTRLMHPSQEQHSQTMGMILAAATITHQLKLHVSCVGRV